ncbi:hypothetical protein [Curvivirga sp.]|uniref:hypothetical protein n=1 Tax=Curvivirga sp. TaxID=2856848 RepID=UPI003B5CD69F
MTTEQQKASTRIGKRPAAEILTLKKMGTSFSSRLSFMRNLIRKIHTQKWKLERREFNINSDGFGHAVYTAHTGERSYSLVAFTHDLPPEKRTDRVIAEAWDATFNLFDGIPSREDIERLSQNTPKQEAGRFSQKELVLGRANKSLRMFATMLECLKAGQQPNIDDVAAVGYLMRTTAVYGSGKFGCADRSATDGRAEIQASFHAEMLAVYLFRSFTIDLIDHIAKTQAPDTAIKLDDTIKRFLGIGNSTGLGMAPFLLKHSKLMHQWVNLKEEALCRCRNQSVDPLTAKSKLKALMPVVLKHLDQWNVEDQTQTADIQELRGDINTFDHWLNGNDTASNQYWNDAYIFTANNLSVEALSFVESLIIECNGDLVDELADQMFEEQGKDFDPTMPLSQIQKFLQTHYAWVDDINFAKESNNAMFWYYSEEKLEPRFGSRTDVPGAELEMPLAIARDVVALKAAIKDLNKDITIADFLIEHGEFRHVVRRIQTIANYPYGEVYDNLISDDTRPIDLLRFKLAFFGANKFDPKSSLWTRINMYQGAPLLDEILDVNPDSWAYPVKPEVRS